MGSILYTFTTSWPHIIGKNLKENSDLLDSDDVVEVWNRYIGREKSTR